MPADKQELVFLKNGIPVQPDPAALAGYETLAGRRMAYWPSSPEISSAMLNEPDAVGDATTP